MVREAEEVLNLREGSTLVDATLGTGGHAIRFAGIIGPGGRLIGLDRDPQMLDLGRNRIGEAFPTGGPAMSFHARPYEALPEILDEEGLDGVDAVLLDLGVNSLHLDIAERGFSFSQEGPLDGRFNANEGRSSMGDLVNNASERDLATWLHVHGDERFSRQIARRIVHQRRTRPFVTTTELAALVSSVYPADARHRGIHPATRTFQALRIVANDELGAVDRGVRACARCLAPGGRLACITFHSGEDRIVKGIFRELTEPRPDPGNLYSATTSEGIEFTSITRRAIACSDEEAAANPRARSAKLRGIQRKASRP
ncbi:16S rRNA (cytosine(1402)-N(4))-methyltransferase RsmH [Candidatus Sumerlaeota bacterium]|nr:16S rRNA (cytosine(1402)-N(4))-methyltransferase RsmH [Candidatus Sumerlaeota bacterium]